MANKMATITPVCVFLPIASSSLLMVLCVRSASAVPVYRSDCKTLFVLHFHTKMTDFYPDPGDFLMNDGAFLVSEGSVNLTGAAT